MYLYGTGVWTRWAEEGGDLALCLIVLWLQRDSEQSSRWHENYCSKDEDAEWCDRVEWSQPVFNLHPIRAGEQCDSRGDERVDIAFDAVCIELEDPREAEQPCWWTVAW